jgi:hypothetical protein
MTDKLYTSNKRIIEFYKKYTCFDFETINISIINMLENIVSDSQNKLSNSTVTELLSMFTDCNKKLDSSLKLLEQSNTSILKQFETNKNDVKDTLLHIRELIMNQKTDLENIIVSKLSILKQNYIDEIKVLFQLNEQHTSSSISSIIEHTNNSFIDRINLSINDLLPKMSEPITKQLYQSIELFKSSISVDNLKLQDLIKSNNNTELINNFINTCNFRFSELVKNINDPIISFITCSEEKLKTNIESVKTNFNTDLIISTVDNNTTKLQSSINSIDKTELIISTLENYTSKLQSSISSIDKSESLKSFISTEMLSIFNTIKNNSNNDNINSFISSFDSRLNTFINNLQTPVINTINTLEDRLTNNISTIKSSIDNNNTITDMVNKNLNEHLNKYKSSTTKGQLSENRLFNDLTRLYTDAEISNISNINRSADILFCRNNKPKIRFENKDYTYNVPEIEVEKFKRDLTECNDAHGIFISQSSGIANRPDWTIEKINNFVILFIHNANYDLDKLTLSVKIIDLIESSIICSSKNNNETNNPIVSITDDDIRKISNELKTIMDTKSKLLEHINSSYIKSKELIDDIKIPHLETILLTHSTSNPTKFICDYCNYEGKTARALSMHLYHSHKKNSDVLNVDDNINSDDMKNENCEQLVSPSTSNIDNTSDTTSLTITKKPKGRKKKTE